MLENIGLAGKLMLASGRLSSEIASKCSRWSIPIVASRTAPTHLAIEIAELRGITLVGFVRGTGSMFTRIRSGLYTPNKNIYVFI